MTTKEEWRDVKGFEGIYQVSSLGRVRSLDRIVKQRGKKDRLFKGLVLSPSINNAGYYRVSLCVGQEKHERQIHNIVAETFLNKPQNCVVDHINFNKLDNRAENLRYISQKENVKRSVVYREEYERTMGKNPRAKKVIGCIGSKIVERIDCGKLLSQRIGMNYSTFRYKMKNGGVLVNNIFYRYET